MSLLFVGGLVALLVLLLALKLSQRLTLRLKVLAGVTVSRNPAKSCPHLGLAVDPFAHRDMPADEHRCYLWMQRDRIDLVHQKGFCLTAAHHKCPWLVQRRPDAPPPLRRRIWAALAGIPGGLRALPWSAPLGVLAAAVHSPAKLGASFGRAGRQGFARAGRGASASGGALRGGLGAATSSLSAVLRESAQRAAANGSKVGRAFLWAAPRAARAARWTSMRTARAVVWMMRLLAAVIRWTAPRARRALVFTLIVAARASRFLCKHVFLGARWAAISLARFARWLAPRLVTLASRLRSARSTPDVSTRPVLTAIALPVVQPEIALPSEAPPEYRELVMPVLQGMPQAAPDQGAQQVIATIENLLREGVAALDRDQEGLAYQLFVKATEQSLVSGPAKLSIDQTRERSGALARAWFWRAKTAETLVDLAYSLEQALRYDPENLQVQAHLSWARERMARDQRLSTPVRTVSVAVPSRPAAAAPVAIGLPVRQGPSAGAVLGHAVRIAGALAALAMAVLWMTSGVTPALARYVAGLPAADQALLHRLLLSIDFAAFPGSGRLDLPGLDYNLALSAPFVLAFLFVFTARGLMDGDLWARTFSMLLAGAGGWLCIAAVTNPDAARVALVLSIGIIVAAVAGRFESPARGPGRNVYPG